MGQLCTILSTLMIEWTLGKSFGYVVEWISLCCSVIMGNSDTNPNRNPNPQPNSQFPDGPL